jgi:hypothetical protein
MPDAATATFSESDATALLQALQDSGDVVAGAPPVMNLYGR